MPKSFGGTLRELREKANVTLGTLARHLEVSTTYLSDVERNTRTPLTKARILAVAAHLGINPQPLLTAAARDRGAFELDTNDASERKLAVGAMLARRWPSLSDDQLQELARIVGEDEE